MRHSELLDWLERQLSLTWLTQTVGPAAAVVAAPLTALVWPDTLELKALSELVQLGFFRGIMNQLDKIGKAQPECHAFVAAMQVLARQFEFEAMARQIDTHASLQKTPSGAAT